MNQDDIEKRVRKVLSQALNAEPDNIKPHSKIVADLGAESIDFLDFTFRLEREFNLQIEQKELFPENVFQGDAACMENGKITPCGINKLQQAAPHIELCVDGKLMFDGTINGLMDAFTVKSLVNYINAKVNQ